MADWAAWPILPFGPALIAAEVHCLFKANQ